ncbi:tyrosine-type recombinase/integrase [Thioclava indica]|uniref:Tyr recombinase domain-containing protein n=1 Tax=Thioclava indica TaxID=1353528 RepID=A0A074J4K6_9RHOB|nr:tyrosine-type recombinase/integrase [Thioclava indica]KEO52386.1 hypothetical protein DT23_18670 [Thioclava indica]
MMREWKTKFKRLEGAYSPATMRAYYADVQALVDWCAAMGVEPFPIAPELLCRFLSEEAGADKAIATIERRLYGIRKIHALLGLRNPTEDEEVKLTMRRIRRGGFARQRQAKGMTAEYLDAAIDAQPDTPWGLRNRAMLSLGYDLLTRRSELIALRNEDLKPRADGTFRVLIRRSKADPFGSGRIGFCSRRSAVLIHDWLDWRGPKIDWLFCPIYHEIPINRSLSTTTVKTVIKSSARTLGLSKGEAAAFSGHSLRVGAAQDLLKGGHDTVAIMRAGGWKSVNVLARYLENAQHNVWQ